MFIPPEDIALFPYTNGEQDISIHKPTGMRILVIDRPPDLDEPEAEFNRLQSFSTPYKSIKGLIVPFAYTIDSQFGRFYLIEPLVGDFLPDRPMWLTEVRTIIKSLCLSVLQPLHDHHNLPFGLIQHRLVVINQGRVNLRHPGLSRHPAYTSLIPDCLYFMSPEEIHEETQSNASNGSKKSDVWALIMLAICLAFGEPLLSNVQPMRALFYIAKQHEDPSQLYRLKPDLIGSLSSPFLSFILSVLTVKAIDRPSVSTLLQHPFLQGACSSMSLVIGKEPQPLSHLAATIAVKHGVWKPPDLSRACGIWPTVESDALPDAIPADEHPSMCHHGTDEDGREIILPPCIRELLCEAVRVGRVSRL